MLSAPRCCSSVARLLQPVSSGRSTREAGQVVPRDAEHVPHDRERERPGKAGDDVRTAVHRDRVEERRGDALDGRRHRRDAAGRERLRHEATDSRVERRVRVDDDRHVGPALVEHRLDLERKLDRRQVVTVKVSPSFRTERDVRMPRDDPEAKPLRVEDGRALPRARIDHAGFHAVRARAGRTRWPPPASVTPRKRPEQVRAASGRSPCLAAVHSARSGACRAEGGSKRRYAAPRPRPTPRRRSPHAPPLNDGAISRTRCRFTIAVRLTRRDPQARAVPERVEAARRCADATLRRAEPHEAVLELDDVHCVPGRRIVRPARWPGAAGDDGRGERCRLRPAAYKRRREARAPPPRHLTLHLRARRPRAREGGRPTRVPTTPIGLPVGASHLEPPQAPVVKCRAPVLQERRRHRAPGDERRRRLSSRSVPPPTVQRGRGSAPALAAPCSSPQADSVRPRPSATAATPRRSARLGASSSPRPPTGGDDRLLRRRERGIRVGRLRAVARRLDREVVAAAGPRVDDLRPERLRRHPRRRRTPPRHGPPLAPPSPGPGASRAAHRLSPTARHPPGTPRRRHGRAHGRLDDRPVDAWGSDRDRRPRGPGPYLRAALAGAGWSVAARDVDEVGARGSGCGRAGARCLPTSPTRGCAGVRRLGRSVHGRLDALVNNAAIFTSIQKKPFDEFHRGRVGPDVRGQRPRDVALLQGGDTGDEGSPSFGPDRERLLDDRAGRNPLFLHYVASKAASSSLTRALAREAQRVDAASMPSHRTTSPRLRRTRLMAEMAAVLAGSDASSAT